MAKLENQVEHAGDVRQDSAVKKAVNAVLPFVSIIILVLIWFIASGYNSRILPSPIAVIQRIGKLLVTPLSGSTLFGHAGISLLRVFISLFFALLLGIPMGILIGWNRTFSATVGTIFELIRPIPSLAWIPLIIVWFGIGELPKIIMVFMAALMPVVVNSYTAIKLLPPLYLDVGRMFNASTDGELLRNVVLPASLPTIFAGVRNATSVGWMVVLAAEMLAAKSGLGFLINRGMESFDVPLIMTGMVLIGVVGALLALATNLIERRLCPWNRGIVSE